jgi:hypothetical protein
VTKEQIVKLCYDYAKGAGNGALLPGRRRSSFTFEPDWRDRPWPPKNKYAHSATDEGLAWVLGGRVPGGSLVPSRDRNFAQGRRSCPA